MAAGTNASSGLVAGPRRGGPIGAVWLPAALLAALLLAHVLWLLLELGGMDVTTDVDGVFILGSAAVAAVLCGRRARASRERRIRLGWWLLAAFELLFVLGIVITIGYTLVLGTVPAPSLADVAYLADAVSAVCAVLLLGGTAWDDRTRLLLDGGIVACSLVLLSWLTVLQAVPRTGDVGQLALVLYFAYPILDVITATVVLSTVANHRRVDPSLLLVGFGILALAVSDSAFLALQYPRPGLLDAGYTAASVLIALGALIVRPVPPVDREPYLAPWQVLLPYVPLVPTSAVVAYYLLHHGRLDPVSQVLGAVSILLVIVRQLMAVLEARTLAATLTRTLAEQRLLVEQAPVGICRLDGEGRLLSANQRLAKMLGRGPSSLAGVDFGELMHPDDLPAGGDALQEFREGKVDQLAMEARGVRPDGTIVWASATFGRLRDPDGRIDRIVAIV
ncbi:MAG: PAS domain S-box protein, partial [Chloroflexi bacterium]